MHNAHRTQCGGIGLDVISNHNRHHSPCPCIGFVYHLQQVADGVQSDMPCINAFCHHCGSSGTHPMQALEVQTCECTYSQPDQ